MKACICHCYKLSCLNFWKGYYFSGILDKAICNMETYSWMLSNAGKRMDTILKRTRKIPLHDHSLSSLAVQCPHEYPFCNDRSFFRKQNKKFCIWIDGNIFSFSKLQIEFVGKCWKWFIALCCPGTMQNLCGWFPEWFRKVVKVSSFVKGNLMAWKCMFRSGGFILI